MASFAAVPQNLDGLRHRRMSTHSSLFISWTISCACFHPQTPYTDCTKNLAETCKKHLTWLTKCGIVYDTSEGVYFLCAFLGTPLSARWAWGRFTISGFLAIGGTEMRVKITLACTECKQRNYNTMKNKKNDPDRLEMNKYCRFCRKHTVHRETK